MISSGFYKLKPTHEPLYALFTLDQDVEITTFDGEGRDVTMKGFVGDILVLAAGGDDTWSINTITRPDDAEKTFGEVDPA